MKFFRLIACSVLIALLCCVLYESHAETLVLDESGYFRSYLLFERDIVDGQLLREQGPEMLGGTRFTRLQRSLVQQLGEQGIENASEVWYDHVEARYYDVNYWNTLHDYPFTPMVSPSADWANPDFDDTEWVRRKMPLQMGANKTNLTPWQAFVNVRRGYFRGYFNVDDPQNHGPYTLNIGYRGGVRVFVNGVEIARGHLPEGDLDEGTLAEPYPLFAYLRMEKELSEQEMVENKQRNDGNFNIYDQPVVRDVTVPYEEAGEHAKHDSYFGIAGETWNRLYHARTRTLGPIRIPAELLRKGSNVIAVEVRRPPVHPIVLIDDKSAWFPHSQISRLELRAASADAPTSLEPPAGIQVWAEDPLTRIVERDYLEPGARPGEVRIVAARNGEFTGQIVIRSDSELTGLQIVASELKNADGQSIPAEAVQLLQVGPVTRGDYYRLQDWRHKNRWSAYLDLLDNRYGPDGREMKIFADLIETLPETVPAATPQPIMLLLKTPADAVPGRYTGSVRVSAEGMQPVEIPVHVELTDWTLPSPNEFQTNVLIFQDVISTRPGRSGMLSDEHMRLMNTSLRHLARIGSDWINIPVIQRSASDRSSSNVFIRWIRGNDGQLRFEFDMLDRYLDLVLAAGIRPKVINFHIQWSWHGSGQRSSAQVPIYDEATGKVEIVNLGPPIDMSEANMERWGVLPPVEEEVRRETWRQFAHAVHAHMKNRGLADVMYWGTPGDREADPALPRLMQEFLPTVYWNRWSHMNQADHYYRAVSVIYPPNAVSYSHHVSQWGRLEDLLPISGLLSGMGWRDSNYNVANPRVGSSVNSVAGSSPPVAFRIWPDRAIAAGYTGIGYAGGDGPGNPFGCVGTGIDRLLWQSPEGFRSGLHVEALREGIQEAEARIFIEQALKRGILSEDLARRTIETLNAHFTETGQMSRGGAAHSFAVYEHPQGWLSRSRKLYALAGEVAREIGMRPREEKLAVNGAVGEIVQAQLHLDSWTSDPLNWEVKTSDAWLQPARTSGTLTQAEALQLNIDLRQAAPDQILQGRLEITDRTNGRTYQIPVAVEARRPLELEGLGRIAYLKSAEPRSFTMRVVNHASEERHWQARPSENWITVQPSAGQVIPGTSQSVQVTFSPPHKDAARLEANVSLGADSIVPLLVYVETDGTATPEGEPIYLVDSDSLIHSHHTLANPNRYLQLGSVPREGRDLKAVPYIGYKSVRDEFDEIIYDISAIEVSTFATTIELTPSANANRRGRARFRIITDGQLRFDSGYIEPGSDPIPVVVSNLGEVTNLTLLFTRYNADHQDDAWWRNARLYR